MHLSLTLTDIHNLKAEEGTTTTTIFICQNGRKPERAKLAPYKGNTN